MRQAWLSIGPKARRLWLAAALFLALVGIALFVRDRWLRPYGGDILVVIFLYTLARGLTLWPRALVGGAVFLIAAGVEAAQALQLIETLGWSDHAIARVVIGTTADLHDIAMYGIGTCIALWLDPPARSIPKEDCETGLRLGDGSG